MIADMTKFFLAAAWLSLGLVAFVTLAPIHDRPTIASAHLEHFSAFFVLGIMFLLAYPSRIVLVILVVVGSAIALEALQLLTPDRHGRLIDALVKVAGSFCGISFTCLARVIFAHAKTENASRG